MAVIEGVERRVVGGVDAYKDLHIAAVVDEQDRVPENSWISPRPATRPMGKCWPGCDCLATCNVLAWNRPARLWRWPPAVYAAGQSCRARGSRPSGQTRSRRAGEARTTISTPRNAAHAALAGQRTVTPRSQPDGMIEIVARRKSHAERRRGGRPTRRSADDPKHDCLRPRRAARPLTQHDPHATHPDAGLIAVDAMISAIVDELAPNLVARNSIGQTGAAPFSLDGLRQPRNACARRPGLQPYVASVPSRPRQENRQASSQFRRRSRCQ